MDSGILLTHGRPWKAILAFMWPIFAGLLLQQLYNTVDTLVVGNFIGESALAAVGACGVLTMAFLALANGFSAGAGILVAQYFGAGNEAAMRRQACAALAVMFTMGIAATAVGILSSRFALEYILSTPASLIPMADRYFQLYAVGLVFQFGYNVVAAVLRGVGDSRATLYFLIVASAANVVLDIVFVYQFNMGVAGAALATDIAQAASCASAILYMIRKYPVFRWKLHEIKIDSVLMKHVLGAGFPIALQQFIVSVGFVFLQRAVNSYGESMTASFSVAQKVESYLILPANALMTTQGTYTGQNLGAGRTDRVLSGARATVLLSELLSGCILLWTYFFADPIVAAFGLQSSAAAYCAEHIRCVSLSLVVFAAYFPLLGLFQGANDAFYATLVATTALAVRVASTYILQEIPGIGYRMIWWNAIVGWGAGFVLTFTHLLRGKWKHTSPEVSAAQTIGTANADSVL